MELCERIIDGDRLPAGIKPAIKTKLANFVGVVRKLRRAAHRVCTVPPEIFVPAVLTSSRARRLPICFALSSRKPGTRTTSGLRSRTLTRGGRTYKNW